MRRILAVLLSVCVLHAQEVVYARFANSGGGGGTVTLNNHATSTVCTNNALVCTFASRVVASTGDTAVVSVAFCANAGCSISSAGCTVAITDGTNTYSAIAAATYQSAPWNISSFSAKNATAGTYTITYTISGSGCTWDYAALYWADFGGTSTSAPIDTGGTANGTGTTLTVTSAGNVTNANEYGYAILYGTNAVTATGSYSQIDSVSTSITSGLANPTSGATTSATGTQTSAAWWATLVVLKW